MPFDSVRISYGGNLNSFGASGRDMAERVRPQIAECVRVRRSAGAEGIQYEQESARHWQGPVNIAAIEQEQ